MEKMEVGIDNYCLHPLDLSPLEILQWAEKNGADGVQFSGLSPTFAEKADEAYLKDLSGLASDKDLYLEWGGGQHIPFDLNSWKKKDVAGINKNAAEQAALLGTKIVRSCSGGLMRWDPGSPMTETLLEAMAESLKAQRQMLLDHDVILAIETHFEFTTHELLRLFELCETEPGEYLGICLDTMNLLTMLEDPASATQRVLPWVVCTHIKDGAVILNDWGLKTFPAEIGKGVIPLQKIFAFLGLSRRKIHLTIEDHGGEFLLPVFDPLFLSKFPDLTAGEFARIIQLAGRTEKRMKKGEVDVTPREDWARICEARTKRDILSLRQLVQMP